MHSFECFGQEMMYPFSLWERARKKVAIITDIYGRIRTSAGWMQAQYGSMRDIFGRNTGEYSPDKQGKSQSLHHGIYRSILWTDFRTQAENRRE